MSKVATRSEQVRRIHSTVCSGRQSDLANLRGIPSWAMAVPVGTSSVLRSRWIDSAWDSTFKAGAVTSSSPTTKWERPKHMSSKAAGRTRSTTSMREWSASTARKCRSPRAISSLCPGCATTAVTRWPCVLRFLPITIGTDWDWHEADLLEAEARLHHWRIAVTTDRGPDGTAVLDEVRQLLADDLNAPAALSVIDRWADQVSAGEGDDVDAPALVADVADALLGIRIISSV